MAKQIILYNLKDNVTEEDYVKWCESYKGPFLLGLNETCGRRLMKYYQRLGSNN